MWKRDLIRILEFRIRCAENDQEKNRGIMGSYSEYERDISVYKEIYDMLVCHSYLYYAYKNYKETKKWEKEEKKRRKKWLQEHEEGAKEKE